MDKDRLQFNSMLEARAAAIGLDASSISEDTRARVAAMLKSRRDRMMEEEREFLENLRNDEANASFTREIAGTLTEDEQTARLIVKKQCDKAFERIVKTFDEQFQHLAAGMLTLRQQKEIEASRDKKLRALEKELNRERFYLYWDMHQQQRNDMLRHGVFAGSPKRDKNGQEADVTSPEAQMHRMTAILRRAYENSAPQFATDPEELWKRGQALPPTAASSRTVGAKQNEFDLPAYHELGKQLREKYQQFQMQNGVGGAVKVLGGSNNNFSSGGGGVQQTHRPKSSATFPYQQDSPFKTHVRRTLDEYLQ